MTPKKCCWTQGLRPGARASTCRPPYYTTSVIPLSNRSCSACKSFVRLGHHNG